ncbi:uncharacterized protein [Apostichopus japonicus]|uniref:uncharacterized protein isoform X2 n=1 Tax=Stichopus japonicus TaxID=307972 RepID=UPI003AB34309
MELGLCNLFYSLSIFVCACVAMGIQPIFQGDEDNDWGEQLEGPIYDGSSSYSIDSYSYFSSDNDVSNGESDSIVEEAWEENNASLPSEKDTTEGRHGLLKLDHNEDGFITKHEYSLRNPDVDAEIVRTLFDILDNNGDDKLTQAELDAKTDFWETTEDCEVFAMQQCDSRLAYTVELNDDVNDTEAMCQGLQAYLDCLSSESSFCDFSAEFLRAVYTFADSYKRTKLCKNLVIDKLAKFGESNNSSRRKRAISTATESSPRGSELECAVPQLSLCSSLFNRSLREAGNFCSTLNEYRHCVSHAAKSCNDETLLHLKESVRILAHMHKKFQVCDIH